MINSKGFSKFEIIIVLLLIILVMVISFSFILKPLNKQKIEVMRRDALVFSNTVVSNIYLFDNTDVIYLDEAINEKILKEIKNPFGKGTCDITESKVSILNGKAYPTLKCGNYLIENSDSKSVLNNILFRVSDWSNKVIEKDNIESKVLYNCKKDNIEIFDNYYEEEYFIYKYNIKYNKSISNLSDISKKDCHIVTSKFYREKEEIKE